MSIFNKRDAYGAVAIILHWLLFLLIAGLVVSGKYSDSLPTNGKDFQIIGIHKQVGVAVFMLMVFRLLWRMINRAPDNLEGGFPAMIQFLVHWLLYLTVLGQALIGMSMSQLSGLKVSLLGWELPQIFDSPLPELLDPAGILPWLSFFDDTPKATAFMLREWHEIGGWLIIGLVGFHFLGAMYHWILLKDDAIKRMWFGYVPGYARSKVADLMAKKKR